MRALLLLLAAPLWALDAPPGFRLPNDVTPQKYTVSLTVDPAKDTFEGTIEIAVQLQHKQQIVWLNAKELTVTSASAGSVHARAELVGDEFLALQFEKPVGPGRVVLKIEYQAKLREKPDCGGFPYAV